MPEAGTRVPAWRRLGLALKRETQPGVTAPEPNTPVADPQHVAPYGGQSGRHDIHSTSVEPAVNGSSAKLGKRKHQHEPAEDDQPPKRGKASSVEVSNDAIVVPEFVASTDADNIQVAASSEQPASADASQPKGDPNYRKKKSKPKSKRRVPEDVQVAAQTAQPAANNDRSSLSPGANLPPKKGRQTLLASTETEHEALAPTSTPQSLREISRGSTKDSSSSPSGIGRRKSVAFTPDTKRVDGHSAQNLFKKWAADQKGVNAHSSLDELEERARFLDEQTARNAEEVEAKQKKDKKEKAEVQASESSNPIPAKAPQNPKEPTASAVAANFKGKKKDPSLYISYLTQYHTDRSNWKFNKAKQNDVIDNATNIFRIPDDYSDALLEYVQGLKGAGAIELLSSKCQAALKELDEEDAKDPAMDDPEERKVMHDEAMQARIAKEQKRRKIEGDMEALSNHPHGNNFIRRLRRKRAEALLAALGRTSPILPALQTNGINPLMRHVAPVRDSKKRKRRGDISSSDDSSSDSSSDEGSSSDESEAEDKSSGSGSSGSEAASGSERDSGSESGSGSERSDSSDDDSDSD